MDWQALWLTTRLALATSVVLLVLGLPLAYFISRIRNKFRVFAEALVAIPLVLPPTVLGFYLLMAMGPRSVVGQLYERISGQLLPFSFEGLLVASILYSLPFAVQPFVAAFRSVDRGLVEASWTLGCSPARSFTRIVIPLAWPGIIAGMVLSFAHTLGEFGVVLMVGGNIPGVTRTVSISIYDHVQGLDYAAAGTTSLFLLVVSFVVLSITFALQRGVGFGVGSKQ